MKRMMRVTRNFIFAVGLSAASFAGAQETTTTSNPSTPPTSSSTSASTTSSRESMMQSPEMRQKMAQMHERMASCLNSDRSMDECRQEMMQNCPMMKDGKCDMHGMMGMGHGMGPGMGKGMRHGMGDGHQHHMMKDGKRSAKKAEKSQ